MVKIKMWKNSLSQLPVPGNSKLQKVPCYFKTLVKIALDPTGRPLQPYKYSNKNFVTGQGCHPFKRKQQTAAFKQVNVSKPSPTAIVFLHKNTIYHHTFTQNHALM